MRGLLSWSMGDPRWSVRFAGLRRRMRSLEPLLDLLHGQRITVLTGAGISTDSGIPDYRGPKTRHKARNPIQYRQFIGSDSMRQRYWARSLRGWLPVRAAEPNRSHEVLAELEERGRVAGIITQNVDGLHQAAGSHSVVELHGTLSRVRCLSCGARAGRWGTARPARASSSSACGRALAWRRAATSSSCFSTAGGMRWATRICTAVCRGSTAGFIASRCHSARNRSGGPTAITTSVSSRRRRASPLESACRDPSCSSSCWRGCGAL